jgi:hypothetical protein
MDDINEVPGEKDVAVCSCWVRKEGKLNKIRLIVPEIKPFPIYCFSSRSKIAVLHR